VEAILIDSPAKLLVSFLSERNHSKKITIVSGISGVGKTLWCMKLFHEAKSMFLDVKGLVSIPVYEQESKIGINLQDLESGLFKPLGFKGSINDRSVPVGNWQLDKETIKWGNTILENIHSCQILIIDELGPLEFDENSGLNKSFETLEICQYDLAFVVIRPSLIPLAQIKWPSAEVLYVSESGLST
jgi:nucleoside-triphosphatase THEP1